MDHLPQAGIFVLEESRDTEEQGGGLIGGELVTRIEQEGNLGKEDAASSRLDWGAIEQSCWLLPFSSRYGVMILGQICADSPSWKT